MMEFDQPSLSAKKHRLTFPNKSPQNLPIIFPSPSHSETLLTWHHEFSPHVHPSRPPAHLPHHPPPASLLRPPRPHHLPTRLRTSDPRPYPLSGLGFDTHDSNVSAFRLRLRCDAVGVGYRLWETVGWHDAAVCAACGCEDG